MHGFCGEARSCSLTPAVFCGPVGQAASGRYVEDSGDERRIRVASLDSAELDTVERRRIDVQLISMRLLAEILLVCAVGWLAFNPIRPAATNLPVVPPDAAPAVTDAGYRYPQERVICDKYRTALDKDGLTYCTDRIGVRTARVIRPELP